MLNVIGGGLAGSEAAWQAAERGVKVTLWEMRPLKTTPAHITDQLAELVCSNSLGSDLPDRAAGVLKAEMRRMGSLIMRCADEARVPAGGALAVGREAFARSVTTRIESHPLITLRREEAVTVPDGPLVVASGPLTSNALAEDIARVVGADYLYFYDALAPIVTADSIDMSIAYRASRYDRGEDHTGDYINCPMTHEEYAAFVDALLSAERIEIRQFETEDQHFFEGCLPIEVLAARGTDALAFGPLRPVGVRDPRSGERPHAVVQLRQDDAAGTLYNLVGFQTNLRWPEQRRVLRMIPGLANADFVRLGQMHRNTFLNAPVLLRPTMQYRQRDDLFFAGQITGVEGYVGNAASGLLAGINAARLVLNQPLLTLPRVTMLGALLHYVCDADPGHFEPMKANFGLMPPLEPPIRNKRERYAHYAQRALVALDAYLAEQSTRAVSAH
jgi:methylenetetrahydrofolate--tRNA-(uracil-5-)-methyltransferase